MTRILGKALAAGWLGFSPQLSAGILWSGLQSPPADSTPGITVGADTVLGFHFQPETDLKLEAFSGYIGYPAALPLVFPLPPGPNFEFSLREGSTVLGPELPALTALSLMSSLGQTQSGLPFWYVVCDLRNLPWTLQKDHEYTLTVSPTVRLEWLVSPTAPNPTVISLMGPTSNLSALGSTETWNARLDFTPVPEVNAAGLVGCALLGLAGWRLWARRSARA